MSDVAHHRGRRLNKRAGNLHQPTRERERAMQRFKSMRQHFLSVYARALNHFQPGRHLTAGVQLSDIDDWAVRIVV
jgi:putative transposase